MSLRRVHSEILEPRKLSQSMIEHSDRPGSHGDPRKGKRYSVPGKVGTPKNLEQRRVTIVRPCESFREKKEKHNITFGYAALNPEFNQEEGGNVEGGTTDPGCSVFSIFTGEERTPTVCQQPVGQQADVFISTLTDKHKTQLKKFLDNNQRAENEYFVWIKDMQSNVVTVLSIKTLENHLKCKEKGVRRVKWRHLSTERLSIYRYSLPAITYAKSARCRACLLEHRKLCLMVVWLSFVLLICVTVVLGSLNPDLQHNRSNMTINYRTP